MCVFNNAFFHFLFEIELINLKGMGRALPSTVSFHSRCQAGQNPEAAGCMWDSHVDAGQLPG